MNVIEFESGGVTTAMIEADRGVVLRIENVGTVGLSCAVVSDGEASDDLREKLIEALGVDVLTIEHFGKIAVWSSPKTITHQVMNFWSDF
jgi:hypothetical protein